MSLPVGILGAGPAGLGAAYWLARRGHRVIVFERHRTVGGNAGSFEIEDVRVDYGSHRLHPSCDPAILGDLQRLLGSDLRTRQRHGRIRLRGRWIHFPLRPLDLLLNLPPLFAARAAWDNLAAVLRISDPGSGPTFGAVLDAGLGRAICEEFYFPYARKIWGLEPGRIDAEQARRRVSARTPTRLLRKVLGTGRRGDGRRFYYPRRGYGQISEALSAAAREAGAELRLTTTVTGVRGGDAPAVSSRSGQGSDTVPVAQVWSTIPITVLARLAEPRPPGPVLDAADQLSFRAMILVYLVLDTARFTEFDAHYFPSLDTPITRLSEPKNYSGVREPRDRTVLCAELPCSTSDDWWRASDEELGSMVRESAAAAQVPITAPVRTVVTRRLPQAYPIYEAGYDHWFRTIDDWLDGLDGVLSFGRQGLFAHDNTHHTLAMARGACACLRTDGTFDREAWRRYRRAFADHVVVD